MVTRVYNNRDDRFLHSFPSRRWVMRGVYNALDQMTQIRTVSFQVSDDIPYTPYSSRSARSRSGGSSTSSGTTHHSGTRARRKPVLNARERNIRRLESNERERMRMHSLNDAFQVSRGWGGGREGGREGTD